MITFKQHLFEIANVKLPEPEDIFSHANRIKTSLQSIIDSPYVHTDHVTGKKYKFGQLSHALISYAGSVQSKFHSQIDAKNTDEQIQEIGINSEKHFKPFLDSIRTHYANEVHKKLVENPKLLESIHAYSAHSGTEPHEVLADGFHSIMDEIHDHVGNHIDNLHWKKYTSLSQATKDHSLFHRISEDMHKSPMGSIYNGGMHPEFTPKEVK